MTRTGSPRGTMLPPSWRRAVLLLHIVSAAGWFAVVSTMLVLLLALGSHGDAAVVAAGYAFHDLTVAVLARPAALTTLLTGLVLAVGTRWGVAKHYWPLAKLVLAVVTIAVAATVGAEAAATTSNGLLLSVAVFHLGTLGAALVLAVYKPGGRIPWSTNGAASPRTSLTPK